uniref:(E)-gamma-bisabolene synthase n=1 Tax=Pseudotsuga menziesii TaxID=3357 RepID=TPSBS_PSEMZ|nr:RecName: Full=(E)-gamma-bisabolene synthase; Short=PmeTPS3 [Pseudotsuga menziesii]AAX07266.1 (E)-gamma-bisabolene synthase [Pseudotsuga menziesii]
MAASTLPSGLSTNDLIRRTANPHPNVWGYDLLCSLKSPYSRDSSYKERADTLINEIKAMLGAAFGDGKEMITPSAYDTAWVARIPSIDGSSGSARPQFPQTVDWILKNQLKDGSWGTESHFLLSEPLLATISCVLALFKWQVGDLQVERGIEFLKSSLEKIKNESDQDSLVTDFEIIFPSMLREAQSLHLGLPYDLPYIQLLQTKRQERLANLSREKIHGGILQLSSLEGIEDMVEWERLMDLQSLDGSFLSSPASTAFVFIHTGDLKCLAFLNSVLAKFGAFVPCLYHVDLLERLLIVDNIERLGIDRHFEKEINEALDYVYRYWSNERGIGWGRMNATADLETTALGFRLLRLHRYHVSPVVFKKFKDADGEFLSSIGQFNKDVASMLNLYRACELAFPGENILDEAKGFTAKYLREALEKTETFSSWNIKRNLSQEIKYALKTSWHASIPRVEAKRYCQVYRPDYARLDKSVYKLHHVNNEKILELAKLDFNIIQSILQEEMKNVTSWFRDSGLPLFSFARQRPLEFYFLITAGTYEPRYAKCRLLFTKVACVETVLDDMYDTYGTLDELKLFTQAVRRWDPSLTENLPDYMKRCYKIFYDIVHEAAWEAEKEQGRELVSFLRKAWEDFVLSYHEEAEWLSAEYVPGFDEYIKNGITSIGQRVLLLSGLLVMDGQLLSQKALEKIDYPERSRVLMEQICLISRLADDTQSYKAEKARGELASGIECYMKDHPECTEEEALNHIYGIMEVTAKELTKEYLKVDDDDVPFACKKMLFEETRVTMVIFKDGDRLSNSKLEMKDHFKECLIEPLPL